MGKFFKEHPMVPIAIRLWSISKKASGCHDHDLESVDELN